MWSFKSSRWFVTYRSAQIKARLCRVASLLGDPPTHLFNMERLEIGYARPVCVWLANPFFFLCVQNDGLQCLWLLLSRRDYRDPQRPWCTGMRMHSRATRTANDTALAVAPETMPRAEPGANRVLPASNPKTARMPSTQSSMGASDLGAADHGLKDASSQSCAARASGTGRPVGAPPMPPHAVEMPGPNVNRRRGSGLHATAAVDNLS